MSVGEAMDLFDEASELLLSAKKVLVVSHYDADGLTAGAIASLTLDRENVPNRVFSVKKLDDDAVGKIANMRDEDEIVWFVDLGSGYVDILNDKLPSYVVSDHHEPVDVDPNGVHMNAHLMGYDGSTEISGAGMVYLLSKHISPDNKDLSAIAIVGAVGDMQDSTGKLVGKNREILEDGLEREVVTSYRDIRLFGRWSRPLVQFIAYSSNPPFPGLMGNEGACAEFLTGLGIPVKKGDKWIMYSDLSNEQKKELVSGLYMYGLENGIEEDTLKSMIGEVYELKNEKPGTLTKDAKDFATLLNACGRHGKMSVGIEVAKGDRKKYYTEAEQIVLNHRRSIRMALEWVSNNGITSMDHMYLLDAGDHIEDSIVGIVAGMLYTSGIIGSDKPIIALAVDENGNLKVSGRGNWPLIRHGLDLGKALKGLAKDMGFAGGGHNIAAGATVSPEKKDEFLKRLDKAIGEQLSES